MRNNITAFIKTRRLRKNYLRMKKCAVPLFSPINALFTLFKGALCDIISPRDVVVLNCMYTNRLPARPQ